MVVCNRYIIFVTFWQKKFRTVFGKSDQNWPKMAKNGEKMAKTVKNSKKCPNTAKIIYLRVKKWSYVIDHFFWHILAKFKKNPRNGFFTKSQKPQNDVNFGIFGPFRGSPPLIRRKFKKAAVLCFLYFWPPTSYQISKKSLERFLRYSVTN